MLEQHHQHQTLIATAQERDEMIAVAAYYLAERRGFHPGCATQDWLQAEQQIDEMLATIRRRGVSRLQFERAGLRNALRLWSAEKTAASD